PCAFPGSAYAANLKELYTNISTRDVLKLRGYVPALTSDAMADTQPLRRMLARHVARAMLDAIAAEYVKGRELWIATTNLDSRERYIWNLTRIAANRHPKALDAKTSRANTRRSSAAHSEALSRGDPNAAGGPSSSASGRPGITADRQVLEDSRGPRRIESPGTRGRHRADLVRRMPGPRRVSGDRGEGARQGQPRTGVARGHGDDLRQQARRRSDRLLHRGAGQRGRGHGGTGRGGGGADSDGACDAPSNPTTRHLRAEARRVPRANIDLAH